MNYQDDIPLDQAIAAHRFTSMVPEDRGRQEREEYARILTSDRENLAKLANTTENLATLETEFARYREGYRRHTLACLAARSRCASTMVTGGSNFNVRRNNKRNQSADNRGRECLEFRTRALDAIRKTLCPELRPIMSGDADAVERLREKISAAEAEQAKMKAANAAIRKNAKAGKTAQVAALVALGYTETMAGQVVAPDSFGNIGFPSYEMTNGGANIRRMRERLVSLERVKAVKDSVETGAAGKVEVCPGENRVRLVLPGKPDDATRALLKSRGFRWAPSLGCWSGYVSDRTVQTAREVAQVAPAAAPEAVPQEAAQ